MKCPYNINIIQVNQIKYEYTDNITTFHEHKLIENREFTECYKEECGAWHNGKCQYKGE